MSVDIEIVDDPARACAAIMVGAAADGGHVVLAGGSTPRAANEEFVAAVKAVGLDLNETTFWFGDDRAVPPDDDRSNFKMVRESLLDAARRRRDRAHRADQGRARIRRGRRRLRARA